MRCYSKRPTAEKQQRRQQEGGQVIIPQRCSNIVLDARRQGNLEQEIAVVVIAAVVAAIAVAAVAVDTFATIFFQWLLCLQWPMASCRY